MDYLQILFPLILIVLVGGTLIQKSSFKVRDYERLVIYRLGRPVGIHGPGFVMVIPFLESGVKYDVSDPFNAKLIDSYLAQGVKFRPG